MAINGMNVHYKDEGEGPVIVLIHGTAASLHTWDAWAAVLQKTHRVIRMDIPAFGLTGPHPTGDYSIDSYVSFLATFFEALSLKKVLLIGNSLGGNIAWQFTAKYPAQVDRLVLVDASGLPTGKAQPWIFSMARTPVINRLFLRITPKVIVKQNLTQVYEDDSLITPALVERYHELALRPGNRQAFIDRAKYGFHNNLQESVAQLKTISQPTLIIWGENDTWIPLKNGKTFDSILPNSTLKVLSKTGHVPMEERPEESLQLVMDFINPTAVPIPSEDGN